VPLVAGSPRSPPAPWVGNYPRPPPATPYNQLDSIMENYDRRMRPGGNASVSVAVSGYVLQLNSVDLQRKEVEVMMYLRQFWTDERLAALTETAKLDDVSSLWHPDLFFVNEMKLPIVNEENFVKISPGGEVLWSKRITKKISCSECKKESHKELLMADKATPCTMRLESYGSNAEDMVLTIKEGEGQSFQADQERTFMDQESTERKIKKIVGESHSTETPTGTYSTVDVTLMIGE